MKQISIKVLSLLLSLVMLESMAVLPVAAITTSEERKEIENLSNAQSSNSVQFVSLSVKYNSNNTSYAVIEGKNSSGDVVWNYQTSEYPSAQIACANELGQKDGIYYFVEGDNVVALNVQSGSVVWKNEKFGGTGGISTLAEDAIYICGALTSDLYIIDYNGNGILKGKRITSDYYWPSRIEVNGNVIAITMEGANNGLTVPKTLYVDKSGNLIENSSDRDKDSTGSIDKNSYELLNTNVSDIVKLMNNNFEIDGFISHKIDHRTNPSKPHIYIYNNDIMPGLRIYLPKSIVNNGCFGSDGNVTEETKSNLKSSLSSLNEKPQFVVAQNGAKVDDNVRSDMRYNDLTEYYGEFDCVAADNLFGHLLENENGEIIAELAFDSTGFTSMNPSDTNAAAMKDKNPRLDYVVIYPEYTLGESQISDGQYLFSFRSDTNSEQTLTHSFYYSDSFFEKKSTSYNHDLAKFTLGLVLAGFNTGKSDENWTVGSDTYTSVTEYGNTQISEVEKLRSENIVNAYSLLNCNVEDIQLYHYDASLNDSSGKVAFSIAHKPIYTNGIKNELVFIILRGGGYGAEWVSNFDVGKSDVYHQGFNDASWDVVQITTEYLTTHNLLNNSKILIGGYSRSAAVANLSAAKLDRMANNGDLQTITRDDIYTYTFATPQGIVDNEANDIHNELYNNIFNIINPCDVVPTLALSGWGFGRYGQSLRLPYKMLGGNEGWEKAARANKQYNSIIQNPNNGEFDAFSIWPTSIIKADNAVLSLANDTTHYVDDGYQQVIKDLLTLLYVNNVVSGLSDDNVTTDQFKNNIRNNFKIIFGIDYDQQIGMNSHQYDELIKKQIELISNTSLFGEKISLKSKILINSIIIIADIHSNESYSFIDKSVVKILKNLPDILIIVLGKQTTGIGSNHYPELYLAWLEAFEADNLYQINDQEYRKITVSCPVNVDVYSSNGTLLASVVNNKIVEQIIPVYINNDSKEIWLLDEDDYNIKITAYDNGTMTYSIEEYDQDFVLQNKTNFYDVELEKDGIYETTVPINNTSNNSKQSYKIINLDDSSIIEPSEIIMPNDDDSFVEISVVSDENGYAYGNQTVIKGEYVSVNADPKDNYEFIGWYVDDNIISTEQEFYFSANRDMTLVAKFEATDPCLNGHSYQLKNWSWDGYDKAVAVFVCDNNSTHVKEIEANITRRDIDNSKRIYTATVEFNGKTYTDEKTINLEAENSSSYKDYIQQYLIPKYGKASLKNIVATVDLTNTEKISSWSDRNGIIGYNIVDMDKDGYDDLLVYIFDNSTGVNRIKCEYHHYDYSGSINDGLRLRGDAILHTVTPFCADYFASGLTELSGKTYLYTESFNHETNTGVMYAEYNMYTLDDYGDFALKFTIKQSKPGNSDFDYHKIEYTRETTIEKKDGAISKKVKVTAADTRFWTSNNDYSIAFGIREMFSALNFVATTNTMGLAIENRGYKGFFKVTDDNNPERFPSYSNLVNGGFVFVSSPTDFDNIKNNKCEFKNTVALCGLSDVLDLQSEPQVVLLGDLDGDRQITSSDALTILRASAGLTDLTPKQKKLADIDGDGNVTSGDALSVLRFSAGLSSNERIGQPIAA